MTESLTGMKTVTCILVGALLTATTPAAATIVRTGDTIVINGPIRQYDDIVFAISAEGAEVRTIVLDSTGGNLDSAIRIGRLIHKNRWATLVRDGDTCASACVAIWASGTPRVSRGALEVHCPVTALEPLQCYAPGRQTLLDYLREVDAPPGMIMLQDAAGSTSTIRVEPAQLVADGSIEETDRPLPPRRPPPPRPAYPPPPPPGWLLGPGGRWIPCVLGMLGICI